MISSIKMGSIDREAMLKGLGKMTEIDIRFWESQVWPGHIDSVESPG